MEPTYVQGDWLLVHWFSHRTINANRKSKAIKLGSLVVLERNEQPGIYYIKRVTEIDHATCGADAPSNYWVESDNPDGAGSQSWGWLTSQEIKGKILFKLASKRFLH